MAAYELREFAGGAVGCGFQWRFPDVGRLHVERDVTASMGGYWMVGAFMLSRTLRLPVAVSAHGGSAGEASGCGFRMKLRGVEHFLVEHDVAVAMSVSVLRKLRRLSEAMRFPWALSKRCSFPTRARRVNFQGEDRVGRLQGASFNVAKPAVNVGRFLWNASCPYA